MSRSFIVTCILVASLIGVYFGGCSKKASGPTAPETDTGYLMVHVGTDSIKVEFKDLPKIDVGGEQAIQLSSFISQQLIPPFVDKNNNLFDRRPLFAYRMVGQDGFYAGKKGYPDNTWEHLQLGYLRLSDNRVIFPDELLDLPGAYDVKDAARIFVYRKFDVQTPDTTFFTELQEVDSVQVQNFEGQLEGALPLKDFIPAAIVPVPENYHYNIRAIDDFGPSTPMTWTQFQTGYWLLHTQKTLFTDSTLTSGMYKLKELSKIIISQ